MDEIARKLHGTTDAMVWAETFVDLFRNEIIGGPTADVGLIVGWFANAIETGRSFGLSEESPESLLCLPQMVAVRAFIVAYTGWIETGDESAPDAWDALDEAVKGMR